MVDLLTIFLISIPAGFIGALTGLGGGSIMVPVLIALGIPVKFAIAASMVTVIATSSSSAASYVKERITNVRAGMYLEMFTIVGAIIGANITRFVEPVVLYFFFGSFLLTSFYELRGHMRDELPTGVEQDRLARWLGLEGSYYDEALGREVRYKLTRPALGGAGMFVAGIAAGMLGIGAGAFKVAVHELVLRMPSKVSSTTSNLIIGITALAGASVYFSSGLLYLSLAVPMAVGTTIGSFAGSRVLNRLTGLVLKVLFLAVVVFLIAQMFYKGVTSL